MKYLLLNIISFLIELIEKYEYRHLCLDENDPNKKIIDSFIFEKTEIEVETDDGWKPVSKVFLTQPYKEWKIKTVSGKELICADHHLLFTPDYKVVRVDYLYSGDKIVTKNGVEEVEYCYPTSRKSSMFDVEIMSATHRFYANDILSHNTVSSGIFIAWYLLFNIDKNAIVLANKAATAAEILDKIKTVIKNLPFFLKPGIVMNNVMTMKFDNGCRVMGQATTKTAAIGFTIHLAYMDEFAHIQSNFLEPFYRSVYPTISASNVSRVIITSTPSGKNKFWQIYQGAVEKKNEYVPLRVDWWEVPGRDEIWKAREIANLGSEELFNQEYGNQFLASERLLLGGDALRVMKKIVKKYKFIEIQEFDDEEIDYSKLTWHPNFSLYDIDKVNDRYVFSIDIADGAGKDYSIINIFKLEPLSKVSIRKMRMERVENEVSFFRLRQVGLYRSNSAGADDLAKVCGILLFKIFGEDIVRISLEMNFKGDYFVEKLSHNENYYDDIFLHTKHNEKTHKLSLGIRLHQHNKMFYCREFRKMILEKRIILNEENTSDEMNDFGVNSKGTYSSQSGHDDIAMTCVNLIPMMSSYSFAELVEDMYESLDSSLKDLMQKKLSQVDTYSDEASMSYLLGKDQNAKGERINFNFDYITK